MNTGFATIPGGAATVLAVAAATSSADPFDKSPLNPLNMSRTVAHSTAASPAPSSKLLDRVRASAADLAELACVQAGWRYVTEKNNTSVYELSGAMLPPSVRVAGNAADYYLVKGVTSVRAGADRVLAMLAPAASDDFSLRMNQLFGRAYHNGVLIDHMSCTAPPARFQSEDGSVLSFTQDDAYSVNWLSLKPSGSSDNFRDFTFASYQDAFHRDAHGALVRLGRSAVRDPLMASAVNPLASSAVNPLAASTSGRRAEGRVLGVHVLSSFNFKDIPELPRTKYTDRFHLRTSGFVVEETHEHGVVRVSFFLSLTPVAATLRNPRKYEKWLQALALSVGNLALQMETPAPTPESDRIRWKHSDHCALCVKSFHTFRRCHHCRFCGESVCNKCSGFVDSSRVSAVRAAAAHDVYSEIRGCKRCIRHLMDEMANGIADRTSASSHSSNGSGRHAKRASSFMNDYRQPSPLVVHHYEDDDQSSMESSSTDGYSTNYTRPQHRQQGHRSASIPVMRPHSDDSLTMDDLRAPSTRLSKPPRDPKTSLSISSASTSQSFDDRVSGGSHKVATVTVSPDFFASRYEDDEDDERYEPLAASAIHANNSSRFDGDDVVDVDVDDLVSQFARSMVSVKAAANASSSDVYSEKMANANAFLQRQTTSSTSSSNSSFKFSLMSNSHLDVLEGNNHHDDAGRHHGPRYSPPRPVSSKLFSISSSGTRQSRPPRPQPAVVDRSRSSSNASQRANEELMMMVPLPTAAPKKTKNDMILLTPVAPVVPQFVEFSDSYRESMDVRPRDVGEMIPLRF